MTTYAELDALLTRQDSSDPKKIPQRKVGNNTYAVRRGEDIAIKLHDTDILTYTKPPGPSGLHGWNTPPRITLNTGGWTTTVTRSRMNDFLSPHSIEVFDGRWYLRAGGNQVPYQDGVQVCGEYNTMNYLPPKDQRKQDAHNAQIRKFVEREIRRTRKVGYLDGDQCKACLIHRGDGNLYDSVLLWEALGHPEHLITHLVEGGALPTSLWWRAHVWKHGNDVGWVELPASIPAFREFMYHHLLRGAFTRRSHSVRPLVPAF